MGNEKSGAPNGFTFITIRGGRHEVPETAPQRAFEMLNKVRPIVLFSGSRITHNSHHTALCGRELLRGLYLTVKATLSHRASQHLFRLSLVHPSYSSCLDELGDGTVVERDPQGLPLALYPLFLFSGEDNVAWL